MLSSNFQENDKIFQDLFIPLITIALVELGDKTQISILLLSSKTTKYGHILIGSLLAFFIVDGLAIVFGSWLTTIIPTHFLKMFSAIVFILVGLFLLLKKEDEQDCPEKQRTPFVAAFALIFLSEWGDKTQIAAALFATEYNPLLVMTGTMIALLLLSLMAIFFGRLLCKWIDKRKVSLVAGIIFIVLGIIFFFS